MTQPVVIGGATLYLGDCMSVMEHLPPVDGVLTDPPYSSGGQFRGDRAMDTRTKYLNTGSGNESLAGFGGDTRDQRSFHFWASLWASAAMRATKSGGIACFFTDWRQLPVTTDYLQSGGWLWRGIVPWSKPLFRPQMGRFGAQCEYVVWGSNGPLPVSRDVRCLPGFFSQSAPQSREHVTQKPVELMLEIVEIIPARGVVFDPFMGSGTTGVAAIQSGRQFIGCELIEAHFDVACRRIEQAHAQRQLFEPAVPPPVQLGIEA